MTGFEKYQRGLALEDEGLDGETIAQRLGYKDARTWWALKNYHKRKANVFNARAAGTPEDVKPDPILAETNCEKVSVPVRKPTPPPVFKKAPEVIPVAAEIADQLIAATKAAAKPEPEVLLKVTKCLTARGRFMNYRLENGTLTITACNRNESFYVLGINELPHLIVELSEMLKASKT